MQQIIKSKHLKGTCKTHTGKEHELLDANTIIEEQNSNIAFTISDQNDSVVHLQLAFYPAFGEYPPVLFGTLEKDGKIYFKMFKKRVRGD